MDGKGAHRPRSRPGEGIQPDEAAARFLGGVRTLFSRDCVVTRAVDGVSLDVEEGRLFGHIGPDGAGKSTTIKVLTGILVPTSGEVDVAGLVTWRERERNALNIGVVFRQRSQLWWDLPLIAYFASAILLDRAGRIGVSPVIAYWSPLVGGVWLLLAYRLWQHEIRLYRSAGH